MRDKMKIRIEIILSAVFLLVAALIFYWKAGYKTDQNYLQPAPAIQEEGDKYATGILWGKLTDASGQPLADVEVVLERNATSSNAEGTYYMSEVPVGGHSIQFFKDGKKMLIQGSAAQAVDVPAGASEPKDYVLIPN